MFSASKSGQYQGYQISRSVRFRSSASAYFNRTFGTASGSTRGTWAGWVKRGQLSTLQYLWSASNFEFVSFLASDKLQISNPSGSPYWTTTMVFRDPSAWYHIVVAFDTTLATAADRCKLWVNGVQITQWDSNPTITQNATFGRWNVNGQTGSIGRFDFNNTAFLDGYQTEIHWIDGEALTPSSFGVFNAYGVWSPIKYNGTYGNNGFYLNFNDNSGATATTIGKDSSGKGNNWTPNNISVTAGVTYDSMLDVPTPWGDGGNGRGNYCVINPVNQSGQTITNGNLQTVWSLTAAGQRSTFAMDSGKWYWEVTMTSIGNQTSVGIVRTDSSLTVDFATVGSNAVVYLALNGNRIVNGTSTAYGATFATGDVIGIAADISNNTVTFYKNGVSQGAITGLSLSTFSWYAACGNSNNQANQTANYNFGQRPFAYTPPSGFNALNTFNLPEPSIDNGRLYMAATTYTGTGASLSVNNTVNNASFQPDFVWVKGRSGATDHALYDAVRGVQLQLESNTSGIETTETTGLTAFNSNGFTVGALAQMNTNTATYVAWQWKEGATQGFDIVTYTGNGANRTIAHNLGVAPSMMIVKSRSQGTTGYTGNWYVYHAANTAAPATDYLLLNTTAATADLDTIWNDTAPTLSVFSIGTNAAVNNNNDLFVAYLFASVAGFSSFGSYTGNGSANGPFVFCGFRPRFVMIKKTTTGAGDTNWIVQDTARDTYNQTQFKLYPSSSVAENGIGGETTTTNAMDILSNGFKLRSTSGATNESAGTFIFAAFAENPFKYSLAR